MKKKKQSAALDVMDLVWINSSRNSYQTLNGGLEEVLGCLIEMDFIFGDNDFAEIKERYRGHYWLGVSANGHHYGERLYRLGATAYNNTFCLAYEKATSRVPFLFGSQRVFDGFEFFMDGLWWEVTGWTKDNQSIRTVGHKNRMKQGKRKLASFTREQWLEARKKITDKILK